MRPKFIKKSIKNSMSFWIVKIPLPGALGASKWSPNEAKMSENRAKMKLKWYQNIAKMEPSGYKHQINGRPLPRANM